MSIQELLDHRCDIWRDASQIPGQGEDENPLGEREESHTAWEEDVDCRFVLREQRRVRDDIAELLVVEVPQLIVGPDTELLEGDEIRNLRNALGDAIPGKWEVTKVLPRQELKVGPHHVTAELRSA